MSNSVTPQSRLITLSAISTVVATVLAIATWIGVNGKTIANFVVFLDGFVQEVNAALPWWIGIPSLCIGLLCVSVVCGLVAANLAATEERRIMVGVVLASPAAVVFGWVAFRPVVESFTVSVMSGIYSALFAIGFMAFGTFLPVVFGQAAVADDDRRHRVTAASRRRRRVAGYSRAIRSEPVRQIGRLR